MQIFKILFMIKIQFLILSCGERKDRCMDFVTYLLVILSLAGLLGIIYVCINCVSYYYRLDWLEKKSFYYSVAGLLLFYIIPGYLWMQNLLAQDAALWLFFTPVIVLAVFIINKG